MNSLFRTRLIKVNIGPFCFSPGILPTIVTVFFLYVMVWMGQWQASKAEYKNDLIEKINSRKDLSAVSLDELPSSIDDRLYLPVVTKGFYDPEKYFLLDNRILNGSVGYDVYTPLSRSDGSVILVNRGFLSQGSTRQDLPEVITPTVEILVRGLLDKVPSTGIVLADNVNDYNSWPIVLQYLDLTEIETALNKPVFDMILRLDEKEEYGFTRVLPALNLKSDMNSGYAFQWYALTLALTIIYIAVNTKKRENHE